MRRPAIAILISTLLLLVAACAPAAVEDSTAESATAEPEVASLDEAPEAAEVSEDEEPAPEEEGLMTLIIWVPGDFDTSLDSAFGGALLDLIADYEDGAEDVEVEIERKRITGAGGMLAYLRSAPDVAPDILPDIVLMDPDNIEEALAEELIFPLELLSGEFRPVELYSAAAELAIIDDVLVSWPYLLEAEHTVYRENYFTDPPCTTGEVLKAGVPFEFAAAPLTGVNNTTLAQYLADGGMLEDEEGNLALDATVLTELLAFYEEGLKDEVISPTVFQESGTADVWAKYQERESNLAVVTSTLALSDPEALEGTGFCPIPSATGEPFAFVSGWSWAVATSDSDRQAAALDLLAHMSDPAVQGNFTLAAGWLPSRPEALTAWGEDSYALFADSLLGAAILRPSGEGQNQIDHALQVALEGVLLDELTSVQAATNAAQLLEEEAEG